MLCRLEVSNYALIENAELNFEKGFTVITGETGAGKSILLKALNLLLGERSDTAVLKQSENKCILEATFDLRKLHLKPFFDLHELDYDDSCIIRREFTQAGKSRCFVNDSPVQLQVLKELGEQLIAVHSQHETLALFSTDFQFDVLDYYAGIQDQVAGYTKKYKHFKGLQQQLATLQDLEARNRKERDYKSFLLNELDEANLEKNNYQDLRDKYARVQNAERIKAGLSELTWLFDKEDNLTQQAGILVHIVDDLKKLDAEFADLSERVKSLKIELQDLDAEVRRRSDSLEFSDEEVLIIREKLDAFNSLCYKHNVNTPEELITLREKIRHELSEIESVEQAVQQTEIEIQKLKLSLLKEANEISAKRRIESQALEKTIRGLLINLSMPDAELQIQLDSLKEPGIHGLDQIDYLFKTNRGGSFLPLRKVASGGELSRLMLAILSTLSATKNLPTLIFDEIDTGVSGEVASRIAAEFERMGKHIQVVAITHLPQVAARGKTHLHVSKELQHDKTVTSIVTLSKKDRIRELAKMISGEKISEAALENAQNLLNNS